MTWCVHVAARNMSMYRHSTEESCPLGRRRAQQFCAVFEHFFLVARLYIGRHPENKQSIKWMLIHIIVRLLFLRHPMQFAAHENRTSAIECIDFDTIFLETSIDWIFTISKWKLCSRTATGWHHATVGLIWLCMFSVHQRLVHSCTLNWWVWRIEPFRFISRRRHCVTGTRGRHEVFVFRRSGSLCQMCIATASMDDGSIHLRANHVISIKLQTFGHIAIRCTADGTAKQNATFENATHRARSHPTTLFPNIRHRKTK